MRRLASICLLAAGLALPAVAGGMPATAAEQVPAKPVGFAGQLAAGQRQVHPLPLPAGQVARGRLVGAGVRLFLLDALGRPVRRLSAGLYDSDEFMFLAGDAGPYALAVQADAGGAYRLEVERLVPRASPPAAPGGEPESPRLRALATGASLAGFWDEVARSGAPLVERHGVVPPLGENEYLVTFLWRGAEHNVRLLGAPSGEHDELFRLGQTDVWYRSYRLPADTRLTYRMAPDVPALDAPPAMRRRAIVATLRRDPLNPRSHPAQPVDAYDGDSLLELPQAPAQAWVERSPGVAAGMLTAHRLSSALLGNARTVHLYRSPGYRAGRPGNALVVLFDGEIHAGTASTADILDNLVAAGRLPPTAAILIGNPDRDARSGELPPNPSFARFLAEELMPWARAAGVCAEPARTVIGGASYGGLAAAWAGLTHPELFGRVYSQSGSFWWSPKDEREPEWLSRRFAAEPAVPVAFLLEAGLFESNGRGIGILEGTRHLRDVLRAKGYRVAYREHAAGHDWYHWRGRLGEGLLELLGDDAAGDASSERASCP
ncbi:MAG: DUF3327 domain-containing protein [Rhodocyclaceae bacterium]|nr:DUF3327 domain-containing protein [Rhodocyclaceae bacterium]